MKQETNEDAERSELQTENLFVAVNAVMSMNFDADRKDCACSESLIACEFKIQPSYRNFHLVLRPETFRAMTWSFGTGEKFE